MFSISPAEFTTIAVVAIIVIGPKRLPELARKFGAMIRAVRRATAELKSGIEDEYRDTIAPLQEVRDEYREAVAPLKEMRDEIESMLGQPEKAQPKEKPEAEEPGERGP